MDITPAQPFFRQQGLRQKRIYEKSSLVFLIFNKIVLFGLIDDNSVELKKTNILSPVIYSNIQTLTNVISEFGIMMDFEYLPFFSITNSIPSFILCRDFNPNLSE